MIVIVVKVLIFLCMGIKQLVYSARNKDVIFDLVLQTVARNVHYVQVVGCVYASSLDQVAPYQLCFQIYFLDRKWKIVYRVFLSVSLPHC